MAKQAQSLGTRGAVIYGDEASSSLQQNLGYIAQADQQRQRQAQARAQQLAQSWRDNALKANDGVLWREEIGKEEQAHINEGISLRNQGVDPYTSLDPRAVSYRDKRRRIEDMRAVQKSLGGTWKTMNDAIMKDRSKYRPDDIEAFNAFTSTPFSDIYTNNLTFPTVRERFDVTTAIKDINPVLTGGTVIEGNEKITRKNVDKPATERAILGRLNSSDGGREFLQSISGGFSVPELRNAPNTIEETEKLVVGLYDSDPTIRETLAVNGIVSKQDPRFQEYVQSEAQRRLQAKQNFEDQLGSLVDSRMEGFTETETRTPDFTMLREEDRRRGVDQRDTRFAERNMTRSPGGSGSPDDSGEFRDGYIPYKGIENGESVTVQAPIKDSRNVKIAASRISTPAAWDLSKGGKRINQKQVMKGDVSRLGVVPISKQNGRLVQENYANSNPDKVEWKKMALITTKNSNNNDVDYLIPADAIQENLTKSQKVIYDQFMNRPSGSKQSNQSNKNNSTGKASQTTLSFFK